jgi:hypothetical protein
MDALRFDALTKSFAKLPARRGDAPAAAGPTRSAHRRSRRQGESCPADRVACGGSCLNPWIFGHDAKNCGACGNACPHGAVCCEGSCLDLTIDAANCGACGNACPELSTCVAGECFLDLLA